MQAPPQMYPQQMPPMVQEAPQLAQAPANPWGGQARNSFLRAISISGAAGGTVVVFTGCLACIYWVFSLYLLGV